MILEVGQSLTGKITSLNLVFDEGDNTTDAYIKSNIHEIRANAEQIVQSIVLREPLPIGCYSNCANNTQHCYDKPTEAGVMLCLGDCFIECYN